METAATAATMNFLVYVDEGEQRDTALKRAAVITEKHPSRLIVLDAADHGSRAHQTPERAELAVGALTPPKLRADVDALRILELPTMLWWTASAPAASGAFRELTSLATLVVVDSSSPSDSEAALREIAACAAEFPGVVLRDLAYLRLAPWQEAIAQFFDDPNTRDELTTLQSIDVATGCAAEALYLCAWLGSALGWSAAGRCAYRSRGGQAITVNVERRDDSRTVQSVTLTSPRTRFIAALSGNGEAVSLSVEGATHRTAQYTPLHHVDGLSLIERAILEPRADDGCATALRMIREILG